MTTLKEVLQGINIPDETPIHRTKEQERPKAEVHLTSIWRDKSESRRKQADPTEDLVQIAGDTPIDDFKNVTNGYFVWCMDTGETWYCPTQLCLDMNFVYRDDLEIITGDSIENIEKFWAAHVTGVNPGIIPRKTCYILDNPGNETYEVYYQTSYPLIVYGSSTPQGCTIHKYANRFSRDIAILKLDSLYSDASAKRAKELTNQGFAEDECLVISDGAWMNGVMAASIVYLDNTSVIKMTEGRLPSDAEQGVLLAEIRGAYNALSLAVVRQKKRITYYYDNTSILNVFKNKKTEYLEEVRQYKEFLKDLSKKDYDIVFKEIHPKTGEDRAADNKALTFFHNGCDSDCRQMCNIVRKDYKTFARNDNKVGTTVTQVMQDANKRNSKNNYNGGKRR